MIWLDVDTAVTVPVNVVALTDDTNFKTRETAVVYDSPGMDLVWNFITSAGVVTQTAVTPTVASGTGAGNDYDWEHLGGGMYSCDLPASGGASVDNDTEGYGYFSGIVTGVLSFRGPTVGFRAAALNDALCDGGDNLDVNLTQIGGTAQRATDLAEIAQYLIANNAEPITDYVADDSLLAKLLAADGDISAYDDQNHSLEAIRVRGDAEWATATSVTVSDKTGFSLVSTGLDMVTAWTVDITGTIDTVTDVTNQVAADMTAISGDSSAANNLELQYDTTGLTGATFPASQAQADRNADLTESQRGSHTWQGDYYYVDPVNGDTHANGNRGGRADPYKTIQDCHDNAVTDNNHDVIFLVSGAVSGATTHTVAATTTISKSYVFIRGPGRNFIITRTGNGDTLAITDDGVEISGVRIGTAATGSGDGIDITDADFARIHHCWFLDTQGDGIHILRGSNCRIHDNNFEGTGVGGSGDGVHIIGTAGSSDDNSIYNNQMNSTAGDAILIEQGTTNDTLIYDNDIHDAGGWGINIGASSTRAVVYNNVLGNNSSGDITDSGSNSIVKNNNTWLYSTTEGRSLDVTATGAAGVDWANVENPSTAVDLSQTDIQLCDTTTTNTDMVGTSNAALASVCTEGRLAELDAANLPVDIDQIKSDLPSKPTKGVGISGFQFFMVLTSDHVTGGTGLTVTPQRSIDGAAFAGASNAVSEIGNGVYKIDLSASDMNGDTVCLKFTAATADARIMTILTQPT